MNENTLATLFIIPTEAIFVKGKIATFIGQ